MFVSLLHNASAAKYGSWLVLGLTSTSTVLRSTPSGLRKRVYLMILSPVTPRSATLEADVAADVVVDVM